MVNNKINIILITGFLGSGKTTLLNRLIERHSKSKLGLIINDFGKISVDGILLSNRLKNLDSSSEQSIYEIKNGSIFCSCLSAELVKALKEYIKIKPEMLIIETSGLSDPSTFEKILNENKIDNEFNILSSVCIIDPISVTKLFAKIIAIEKQIISSNVIVLNKSDIADTIDIVEAKRLVTKINKASKVIETSFAEFDLAILENKEKSKKRIEEVVSCNTVKSRPGSIILRQKEISQKKIKEFYKSISGKILRLKGFINIEGKFYYVSSNNSVINIEEYKNIENLSAGLVVLLPEENIELVKQQWDIITQITNQVS